MSSNYAPIISNLPGVSSDGQMPDLPSLPSSADMSPDAPASNGSSGLISFGSVLESVQSAASSLESANKAESDFAQGKGNLLEMVLERTKADTILSVGASVASKATQSVTTLTNMQV